MARAELARAVPIVAAELMVGDSDRVAPIELEGTAHTTRADAIRGIRARISAIAVGDWVSRTSAFLRNCARITVSTG